MREPKPTKLVSQNQHSRGQNQDGGVQPNRHTRSSTAMPWTLETLRLRFNVGLAITVNVHYHFKLRFTIRLNGSKIFKNLTGNIRSRNPSLPKNMENRNRCTLLYGCKNGLVADESHCRTMYTKSQKTNQVGVPNTFTKSRKLLTWLSNMCKRIVKKLYIQSNKMRIFPKFH